MTADEIARLAYVLLIGTAVTGWLLAEARRGLGPTLKRALIWCFIFLGVLGGVGLWDDIRNDVAPRQLVLDGGTRIEVPRAFDGHYYLSARVNGTVIDFVVDTGATNIVLTREDARRAGIAPDTLTFTGQARTANGIVRTAPVRLDEVRMGDLVDQRVPAVVNDGEMEQSLLGMSYLNRFSRIEIAGDRLVLER